MKNQNKNKQTSRKRDNDQSEAMGNPDYSEPEPSLRSFAQHQGGNESTVLHSKELLRQRNIFWAFTSISTLALIGIIYLLRVLTI